jgi:hypothetical protein
MNIRALVAKVAGEASGAVVPFSGPAAEAVMTELLGVQDEQLEILRELKSTIGRLLDVPWKSARIYMEEAAIPGRSPEQVRQSLEHAAEKLHEAIPTQPDSSPGRADARVMLAIVFAILGDHQASRYHAEIAYREARAATWYLVKSLSSLRRTEKQEQSKLIRSWYNDIEWTAAYLGDPDAQNVKLVRDNVLKIDNIPGQAVHQRSPRSDLPVRWREGARLDFVYVAWKNAVGGPGLEEEFGNQSLAQVLDGPRPNLRPAYVLDALRDQEMGYVTGWEE